MKKLRAVFLLALTFVMGCSNNPSEPEQRSLTTLEKQLVQADNQFGFKLFDAITQRNSDNNVFISPLSISMALGMTLNGANGQTQADMERTLELAGLSTDEINQTYRSLIDLLTQLDPKVIFEIANSIWYRQGMTFESSFLDVNRTYFDAEIESLDFSNPASIDIINNWVKDKTHDKIDKIIDDIAQDIVMFLINAIYFNGTWTYEFDKEMTHADYFTRIEGNNVPCKMMVQTGEFGYLETNDFQAVDLPYGDGLYSMTIFLPRYDATVDEFLADFNQSNWNTWTRQFKADSVTLELPKFKVEYKITLNEVLSALGMGIAFTSAADFTRMYKPGSLAIDYVLHKTYVEVDEEGTEAAAVTVVAIRETSGGPQHNYRFMRVDRPFVFVIRENHSGMLLFMGKIVEPPSGN